MPDIKHKFLYLQVVVYQLDDKYKNTVHSKSYYPDATVIDDEDYFKVWFQDQVGKMKTWLSETFKIYKLSTDKKILYLTDHKGIKYVGTIYYSWQHKDMC
jgi:hypothetical protein